MTVTFYPIAKRINSTKRPTAGGKAFSCVLKTPSSVMNPRISIKWDPATGGSDLHPSAYNYAFINDYHRYYWINEWTYDDRQWTATMSVDVLASWRDTIRTTTKYVLRANDTTGATPVVDSKYPATPEVFDSVITMTGGTPWASSLDAGRVVISVVGDTNGYTSGGLSYFQLSTTQFNNLVKACCTQALDVWTSGGSLGTDLGTVFQKFGENWLKTLNDPFQYIKGAMWFPFSFPYGSSQPIKLGVLNTGVNGVPLTDVEQGFTASGTIPSNMNSGVDVWEKYLYRAPYTTAKLRFLPFGIIPIDTQITQRYDGNVCASVNVDAISGIGRLNVYAGATPSTSGYLLSSTSAQVGVPIAVSNSSINYLQALKSVGGAVGSIAAAQGSPTAEGVLGAAASVGNALQSFSPQISVTGTSGGITGIDTYPAILVENRFIVPTDPAEFGYPLCESRTLGDISGFIQCADPEIELPIAYQDEIRQVGEYLTGGFFNE